MERAKQSERRPLLSDHDVEAIANDQVSSTVAIASAPCPNSRIKRRTIREENIPRVLPIAFAAAFAIAATSATEIFAYANIMCADPTHCKDKEQSRYAGVVAVATTIANVCGVVGIGILQQWIKPNPKLGLCIWLVCRGTGVAWLVVGMLLRSIHIALIGRIFEGFATDNILHYTLSTIWVQTEESSGFSRLMGTSLALYMAGMSFGPTIVTFLPNFILSFVTAISLLGVSLLYLLVFVPTETRSAQIDEHYDTAWPRRFLSILDPVRHFCREPILVLPGFVIFFFNAAQAYLFPAIMVHAALRFGFTSTENGYVISIAALTSSIYLFIVLYVIPNARKFTERRRAEGSKQSNQDEETETPSGAQDSVHHFTRDLLCALCSMSVQLVVLPCFTLAKNSKSIYGLVILIALGLAAPSFIKSYGVSEVKDKNASLAGLAFMESLGGLASPVILGASQSLLGRGSVFIVASSLVGIAMLSLTLSPFVRR
ncbi:hypothetical protein CC78DRAFT_571696 [Lojkania enalia]|uniref:Uncharacterized protein n=1 Tax=Lojkania enalia TaxID=147567 RepID=A0A9P4N5P0_9PLEO|nr:hypothetical protein CC78DRAFT_571696 [Didymosphaeria enalia]